MRRKKKDIEDVEVMEETVIEETVETVPTNKSKRDLIIEHIEAGGATMESLMAHASCKYASVMSNFSMLRLMGKCPVKDVEITSINADNEEVVELSYRLVSTEEWEVLKADKAAKAKTKKTPARTPEQMLEILTKRVDKAVKADIVAGERVIASPDSEILSLRSQKALIELKIANLELSDFQDKNPGVEIAVPEPTPEFDTEPAE